MCVVLGFSCLFSHSVKQSHSLYKTSPGFKKLPLISVLERERTSCGVGLFISQKNVINGFLLDCLYGMLSFTNCSWCIYPGPVQRCLPVHQVLRIVDRAWPNLSRFKLYIRIDSHISVCIVLKDGWLSFRWLSFIAMYLLFGTTGWYLPHDSQDGNSISCGIKQQMKRSKQEQKKSKQGGCVSTVFPSTVQAVGQEEHKHIIKDN